MRTTMKKLLGLAILGGLLLVGQTTAYAIPILQLYIEGAKYDDSTETWVWGGGGTPRLWAIGNISGPGGAGPISDVRLAVAYPAAIAGAITITLEPTLIGGDGTFDRFTDASEPPTPNWVQEQPDGTILPKLSDGRDLPKHDAFGPGVSWQEFGLGNFDDPDDATIADFIPPENYMEEDYSGPEPFDITGIEDEEIYPGGQINAYNLSVDVAVEDGHGATLHFDLYDNVEGKNGAKAVFAPFSHDAMITPEPASFILWFLIGLTWAGRGWAYQYWHRWRRWDGERTAAIPLPGRFSTARPTPPDAAVRRGSASQPGGRAKRRHAR